MTHYIEGPDSIEAESFEFMVDTRSRAEPVIGIRINPVAGEPFIIPLPLSTAQDVAVTLAGHVAAIRSMLAQGSAA